MSICIAFYTHCQMNENPCSNQEIHVLFEHGSELENTQNEPCIICMMLYMEGLRTRLIISPMFLFAKTLCTVMTFESKQTAPFCLEKSSVRKWTIEYISSVFSAKVWNKVKYAICLSASCSNSILRTQQMLMHEKTCVIPIFQNDPYIPK